MHRDLDQGYQRLKSAASGAGLPTSAVTALILEMTHAARQALLRAKRVALRSRVIGKEYFAFAGDHVSRPVNAGLYATDRHEIEAMVQAFDHGFEGAEQGEVTRVLYSIAYPVLAANDVRGAGRKASATFFEILAGHVVARILGSAPKRKVRVPESGAELPTDYIFEARGGRNLHLPVKTSTRERAVQAWVHQLVLERIFGAGAYRGVLIVASETKRDARNGEVIEICVPRQLQMFQARVAEMSRLYYLDPPAAYLALGQAFPRVDVRSLGAMPAELPGLLSP